MVPVSRVEYETYDGPSHRFGMRSIKYQLNFDNFSLDENKLVEWASSQIKSEDDGFQSALDRLVISCMGNSQLDILPHVSTGLTFP